LWVTLALLGILFGTLWALLSFRPVFSTSLLREVVPTRFSSAFVAYERQRWETLASQSVGVVACLALAVVLARRRPVFGAALLLALHSAGQLRLLSPAFPTDEAAPYLEPSPLLADVPRSSLSVHGAFFSLFGHSTLLHGRYPDVGKHWLERRTFLELYPFAGAVHGRRFDLNLSPEDLDSFLTHVARSATERSADAERLRLLAAWGVDRLLLNRELEAEASGAARLLRRAENFGQEIFVYEIVDVAPQVGFLPTVLRAPTVTEGLLMLRSPEFEPRAMVVLPGAGPARPGMRGEVKVVAESAERLEVEVEAPTPGVLVWRRAHLSLYRATIDGAPAPVVPANVHRIGVELPSGNHRVRIWADRAPTRWSFVVALLGAAMLPFLRSPRVAFVTITAP
jgi:hypothetical protein